MTTQTTTPNRPLVDLDIGRISFVLMVKGFRHWQPGFEPPRPLGVVRYEVARQVATFAVPALMLVAAALLWGIDGLLFALAPAILVGWLNDLWLQSNIANKRTAEEAVDLGRRAQPNTFFARLDEETRGRYALMRELAYRLKIPVKAVTPKLVDDFGQRYLAQSEELIATYVKQQKAKEAEHREQQRVDAWLLAEMAKHRAAEKAAAVAAATGLAVEDVTEEVVARYEREQRGQDDDASFAALADGSFSVNPMTGLPMIEGTQIDAGGHVFGTGGPLD